jgi:TolB protein
MKTNRCAGSPCSLFTLLPALAAAQQQGLEIDIVGGNASALPITVVPMPYQGSGTAARKTDVASVVRADLARSGAFRPCRRPASSSARPAAARSTTRPGAALRQDYIVVGRVVDAGDGGYRVEYELFDVAKQERLLGLAMTARANAMRDVAHQMADAIYEKITGVRGAFWTRIAYVTAAGLGKDTRYALMVADADGYNPQTVVRSAEPLLSPSWSPDGASWPTSASSAATRRSTSRTSPPARASWCQLPRHQRRAERSRPMAASWR